MSTQVTPNPPLQSEIIKAWQKGYESQPNEYSYWISDIEGRVPPELKGTFFRNGPGLFEINGQPIAHPFDGDGMICAFSFKDGNVHFKNKFVRTEGYVKEQTAGKILYRGFGTQKPGGWLKNIFDLRFKNVANTSVIYWHNKILALWEGGNPYHLDPATLDTKGLDTLNGILKPNQPFSAHPKIFYNPETQQKILINFGVVTNLSSQLHIWEIDQSEKLLATHQHQLSGFPLLHDMLITPHYYIFFHVPFKIKPLPFLFGQKSIAECLKFDSQSPTKLLVISRQSPHEMKIIETDPFFVFHHVNAWENEGKLYLDSICYDSFFETDSSINFREDDLDLSYLPKGQLLRFEIDLVQEQASYKTLETTPLEMPIIHPEKQGYEYRYVYLNCADESTGSILQQGIRKIDMYTGDKQDFSVAPYGFVTEPMFIPSPNASTEDDGWVLTLVYNAAEHCSELVVLDARDLTKDPVAKLKLSHPIPHGFHGHWTNQLFL